MQPMTPSERKTLNDRGITDAEIDEYQALLSQRFTSPESDPSPESQKCQARLRELAAKIMK